MTSRPVWRGGGHIVEPGQTTAHIRQSRPEFSDVVLVARRVHRFHDLADARVFSPLPPYGDAPAGYPHTDPKPKPRNQKHGTGDVWPFPMGRTSTSWRLVGKLVQSLIQSFRIYILVGAAPTNKEGVDINAQRRDGKAPNTHNRTAGPELPPIVPSYPHTTHDHPAFLGFARARQHTAFHSWHKGSGVTISEGLKGG